MKKITKNQQGISAWLVLPWLIAMGLAAILWLVYYQNSHNVSPPMNEPVASLPAPMSSPNTDAAPKAVSSYHEAVSLAAPSVVNIYTTQRIEHPYASDPMLQQFFEQYYGQLPQSEGVNLGSGVIVSEQGHIVTNAHVIEKASEITVVLGDGRKAQAQVIGRDSDSDLAVIKITLDNLTPMQFRQSPIEVGDVALAIGNPFGVGQTVTQGIISATGRVGIGVSRFEDFIQTDAAINPGNSGGALIDAKGQLIGINTAIYSRSGGSMGIGFAIPTVVVEQVMNDLIRDGKVSRGWLGVEIARTPLDPTAEKAQGLTVANVWADSPAAQAGLQAGDIITAIDGVAMDNDHALVNLVAKKSPNTQLNLTVLRDQQVLTLTATLAQRPNFEQMPQTHRSNTQPQQNDLQEQLKQELLRQLQRLQE